MKKQMTCLRRLVGDLLLASGETQPNWQYPHGQKAKSHITDEGKKEALKGLQIGDP